MTAVFDPDVGTLLTSYAEQLRDAGEATLAMISEASPPEPSVLLSMASAAVVVRHEREWFSHDEPALEIADQLIRAVSGRGGRRRLEHALDALDLGPAIDLDPDSDPVEQVSRLHDLFELGMLVGLMSKEKRDLISEVLDRNAALVLFEPEAFSSLHESACLLMQVVQLDDEHPVQRFIETVIAGADPLVEPISSDEFASGFAAARADVETKLPGWVIWRERLSGMGDGVVRFFQECARPMTALAATDTVAWPAPRLVLGRRGGDEVNLLARPQGLLLECFGASPATRAVAHPTGQALRPVAGPLSESMRESVRYWDLTWDVAEIERVTHIELHSSGENDRGAAADIWSIPIASRETEGVSSEGPEAPSDVRLERWQRLAPGALAAHLETQFERLRATHRAWSQDFREQAMRLRGRSLAPEIGRAWFPAVTSDPDFEGVLGTVECGRLASTLGAHDPDLARRASRWVGRLVGIEGHSALESISVRVEPIAGVDLRGESYDLAAAVAVVSRLLNVAPARVPVLSGRLGEGRAEVLPISSAEAKRRVVALEAPTASVLIVDAAMDVMPLLDALLGDDWPARLRAAILQDDGGNHSRAAVRAWHRFFQQRSVLSAARERDRALREADLALTAPLDGSARAQALWVRGAMRLHRGESARAHEDLAAARQAFDRAAIHENERWTLEECDAFLGIASVDSCRPSEAVSLLKADLARMDAALPDQHDRRWHFVRLQVAGGLSRALGAIGELDEAVHVATESLSLSPLREERARSLMDLAELERRRGDSSAARALLSESRDSLEAIYDEPTRAMTDRFLRLYEVRSGLVDASYEVEPPRWYAWPQPAEVLESLIAGAESDLTLWLNAHVLPRLESLEGVWHLLLLGTLGRLPRRSMAVEQVMRELAASLTRRFELDRSTRTSAELVSGDVAEGARLWARISPY